MKALVRRLRRSLAAPLILLVAAFIAVPILFYLTFQQADQERQEMLLGSIQAQGNRSENTLRFKSMPDQSSLSTSRKVFCGTSTEPIWRIFFLPSFCFSSNLRLRVMSPP